ncbi:pitrilysin family protein [Treponema sp.]|uniref:M16 family metallopeptidase n=1 Tax=Treponema sp. TaxID=166 RepID=UPI0025F6BC5C|nr:pitrilysin family protein [Treponema sp.]MCR5217378.1 insulinase family protein [Treponema sp.]
MIKSEVLQNNIVLVSEHIKGAASAAIAFYFNVGSRYENESERGISHLTEHLLFKGTDSRSNTQITRTFDRMGAVVNAFTERENVCLYALVPDLKDNIKNAVEVLCDMSSRSNFPEEEFIKEKRVVQSEIASLEDDSEECALDEAADFVWKDKSLSKSIGGSVKQVESISRSQIALWYKKYFAQGELSVFVTGSFNIEDIKSQLEKLDLHKKFLMYPEEKHFSGQVEWNAGYDFAKSSFSQCQIYLMYPQLMPLTEKESFTMLVFNAIAGDTMSSRLFESLREKNGLCYSVFSFFTFYENAAAWCASVSTEEYNAVKTACLLQSEVEKIVRDGVSQEEVDAAIEHVCGEEILASGDMEYILKRNQKNFSLGFKMRDTAQTLECIRGVTKNDIMELAKALILPQNKAVIVYGPKLSKKSKKEITCSRK